VGSIASEVTEFEERATVAIDMRLPPTVDPDDLEQSVRSIAGEAAAIEVVEKLPAVRSDKNNKVVRALLAGIRLQGGAPRFAVKTGTSDMNIVAPIWQCPIVAYGPGDSALDHTPDEHIDLREYQKAIDVLEAALLRLE
jgi:LysW-gamma-L-lysine carboxypeptidase